MRTRNQKTTWPLALTLTLVKVNLLKLWQCTTGQGRDEYELEGLQEHQEVEPHLQQEDVRHEQALFLLQGVLIILSKKIDDMNKLSPNMKLKR